MPAPEHIAALIDQFDYHLDAYKKGQYNETQVRLDYINPLMEALGWDVRNKKGYSEAYRDVIHEDALKVGGWTKAPDYCFRIGGTRKFFLEAKKPSINVKQDTHPAYQLRRYAWSAKLPLSILTDFEEFAVYDCRVKPVKTDKPSTARIMYLTYAQYMDQWEDIAGIFSPDAILKGAFDKYVESKKVKRGTAEVDAAFLAEIERWRELLARNIALRNPGLSQREINFSVQRTIDRIIFIRICEDRGIETYGRLMSLQNGDRVYKRLFQLFREADDRYNSGLFHFSPEKGRFSDMDELTPDLTVDDKVLKDILKSIYYPDSPYEFSVLPADILGQVYERFLGKVIRLTPAHRAVIELKPEVRKAGGVYYTPTYIVDYIVKETVGRLLKGKKPGPQGGASKLRILDPACGSGSFLLGAYQYLLDWHRDMYVKDDPVKWARGKNPRLYQKSGEDWPLTTTERKRILLNNIYGVDKDDQAVEVTKLSLLLRVLEGEDEATIQRQLSLFQQRALPDLGSNIKCGNSLIGSDFYDGAQANLFDEEDIYRINAFDWDQEFPEIMKSGGFDAVIGNPPYIRIQALREFSSLEVDSYKSLYKAAGKGNYDIYVIFVEKGLQLLNSQGILGFILPHKFFNANYGESLRNLVAEGKHLKHVVHFGDQQVFSGATTYTCLLFLSKSENKSFGFAEAHGLNDWITKGDAVEGQIDTGKITEKPWTFSVGRATKLFDKLSDIPIKLADVATKIYQGCITSADSVYLFKEYENESRRIVQVKSKVLGDWIDIEKGILRPVVRSGKIGRYKALAGAQVLFPYEVKGNSARLYTAKEMSNAFPQAWKYLNTNRSLLENREKGKFKHEEWYQFGRSQNLGMWEQSKLMVPYMITNLSAYYDENDAYYFINVTTGGYGILADRTKVSYKYLCALMNSKLLDFYLKKVSTSFRGGYLAANKQFIGQLPIHVIDGMSSKDVRIQQQLDILVNKMLTSNKDLLNTKNPNTKISLKRQIQATDRQIDKLVYELYELTDEEIEIIETANK